ncbi:uncharacterized protein LOC131928281 [Physella acuta]|uniref:uncharacterized protein LOC131928281 n=1 Tax=Physella acuta TaxID=109671 RepID=UPI0027DB202D|nr:uncharacterized protein LOC131928281 [Physella acuta]XP_059140254.1 uncharacterized protein LOC131928281 [Physella acuta]
MATSDFIPVLSNHPPPSPTPEWSSEPVPLKEFSSKRQVPGFAKIVKGNYMTLGSNKFSFQKQYHEVFIHSVKVGVKVLAHCLRRVDATSISRRGNHNVYTTTRLYAVDQRLAIPISYQGWFELLSEDGKSARPITSVHELARIKPDRCLVRENTKAYIMSEDEKFTFDKTKIVIAGEQLVLNGEVSLPAPAENKKIKLLRCFDSKGELIYLSFDQKATFTPIAGEEDFVGVFNIRDIVRRFRLPLTVKLVQGVRPKVDPSRFTGLIRLDWVYTDETAFVCPVDKNIIRLLPVPTDSNLQLVSALNQQAMKSTELYRSMIVKCNRMITNYNNTLHLIVQVPDAASKGKGKSNANVFSMQLSAPAYQPSGGRTKSREHLLMDEIDDLYAYVRDGGAPPTKFTYDSDEESYWEEPAYEPLDDFRARLKALEAGERVSYHVKYQPQDPSQLKLDVDNDLRKSTENLLEGRDGLPDVHPNKTSPTPPALPPRPPDLLAYPHPSGERFSSSEHTKPFSSSTQIILSRNSQSEHNVTRVSNLGMVSSNHSSHSSQESKSPAKIFARSKSAAEVLAPKKEHLLPPPSTGANSSSTSGSSGNGHRNHIARDFKDSDISSMTRGASSGSSGGPASNIRKKMQTLYL